MTAYALDTNLGLRMWTRRFLHAACAARGSVLVIPETAAEMMGRNYELLNTRRVEGVALGLWRDAPINLERTSTSEAAQKELEALQAHLSMAWTEAFASWLATEPSRNDSHWQIAPTTRETQFMAIMLRQSRILKGDAARDRRYGYTGEDPQVIAEAIAHGVTWIASDNFGKGMRGELNKWIAERSEMAGIAMTDEFIVTAEQATEALAGPLPDERGARRKGYQMRTRLAYLVARDDTDTPANHRENARRLNAMMEGLRNGGLPLTAGTIEEDRVLSRGWTEEEAERLEMETGDLAEAVRPALESDRRRRAAERAATEVIARDVGLYSQHGPTVGQRIRGTLTRPE